MTLLQTFLNVKSEKSVGVLKINTNVMRKRTVHPLHGKLYLLIIADWLVLMNRAAQENPSSMPVLLLQ